MRVCKGNSQNCVCKGTGQASSSPRSKSGLGSWDNRVWRTQRSFRCVLASSICLGRTHQLIDSVLNLLFRCPHKRITRPITPVSKTGVRNGDTYVVCLECGKQFTYDLNEMRIGKPVAISPTAGVLHTDMPKPQIKKLRLYAALASAVPIAWIVSKALKGSRKAGRSNGPHKTSGTSEPGGPGEGQ